MMLVTAALFAWLGSLDQDHPGVSVVVAARQVRPGAVLTGPDLLIRQVSEDLCPDAAVVSMDEAVGQRTIAGLTAGTIVTRADLLADPWSGGGGEELVPFRLDDPAVGALVRAGQTINVVSAPFDGEPVEVAHQVRVVQTLDPSDTPASSQSGWVVLVAASHDQAVAIASAAGQTRLSVVITAPD